MSTDPASIGILSDFQCRLGAEWSLVIQGPRLVALHRTGTHIHRPTLPSLAAASDELERDIIDAEATWRVLIPALTATAQRIIWIPGWVHRAPAAPHHTGPVAHGQTLDGHTLTARIASATEAGYRVEMRHLDLCDACVGDGATLLEACAGATKTLRSYLAHVRRRVFTAEDAL